jgi:hypothetical protein
MTSASQIACRCSASFRPDQSTAMRRGSFMHAAYDLG